jgi:D-alanyl-D-alanine carboxypeptidase
MKHLLFIFSFLHFATASLNAQTLDTNKLNSYFATLDSSNKFMGSVAIAKDNKIIYTKTIGLLNGETKANKNTKYRIGSISKTFTAALVFKAIEENKLTLNQSLSTFFPKIANAKLITISSLLNHRSGIHNFTDDAAYLTYNQSKKSEAEMLDIIEKAGSDFTPGAKADYSNSNYVLLTYILEKIYKKPYRTLLSDKIAKPLALKNTYAGSAIDNQKNECYSYAWADKWEKETETDMSIPMGAGCIVSTSSDLALFADALFSNKIISAKSVEQMQTIKEGYGMGLFQVPFGKLKGYGHTGGIDGFSSVFHHFAKGNYSYAVTSNGTEISNNDISIVLLSAVYNQPFAIPSFAKIETMEVSEEILKTYVGVYASKEMPLKITVSTNSGKLVAQATKQNPFELAAISAKKFVFEQAGIEMLFEPNGKLAMTQAGQTYNFSKE